jgi:hypothetical protein
MGWFIGAFEIGVVEHPRSAGSILERRFMASGSKFVLKEGDTCLTLFFSACGGILT